MSDIWIDSLALSRIALPRLASHKLSFMADLFGCDSVSHRANADVDALCGVWRVLLVALTDLPQGLMARLADMHPDVPWSYRPIFSFLAGQNPGSIFSLSAARADVLKADRADDRVDADELPVLKMPSREEIETMRQVAWSIACIPPTSRVMSRSRWRSRSAMRWSRALIE